MTSGICCARSSILRGTPLPTTYSFALGTLDLIRGKISDNKIQRLCCLGGQSKLPVSVREKGSSQEFSAGRKYSVSTPEGITSMRAWGEIALRCLASASD